MLPSESDALASATTDPLSKPLNVHVPPDTSTTRRADAMALSESPAASIPASGSAPILDATPE